MSAKQTPRSFRAWGAAAFLAVMTAAIGIPAPAHAAVNPEPVVGPTDWVPDGPILAIASQGDRVYVGGKFTGGVAALDSSSGRLLWRGNADNAVRAIDVSADGRHIAIGGRFTSVDDARHRKLALLDATTGTAESHWKAVAGGTVKALIIVGDTVYFGGSFAKHRGIEQRSLGAVKLADGQDVAGFRTATDGVVHGLDSTAGRLFITGKFTAVDGAPRNQVASVSLAGHTLDAWAPARGCTRCNLNWDITVGNGLVYLAGRNNRAISAIDMSTGLLRWSARSNGDGQAVALFDGKVWVGGHYISIAGQSRKLLAAFDPMTGAIAPFNARFVQSWPGIWALDGAGNRLTVGGYFNAAGPKPNRYRYLAMFGTG